MPASAEAVVGAGKAHVGRVGFLGLVGVGALVFGAIGFPYDVIERVVTVVLIRGY